MHTDPHPPPIDKSALAGLLDQHYSIPVHELAYHPVGEDSEGYIARARPAGRYFVKVHGERARPDLARQLAIAHSLHRDCGLEFVLPALPDRSGQLLVTFGPLQVSVYEYLVGTTHYQEPFSWPEQDRVAVLLARLHDSARCPRLPALEAENYRLPFRPQLLKMAGSIKAGQRPGNRYQEKLVDLLASEAADLLDTLSRSERMGRALRNQAEPLAVTHGDPTSANIIKDRHGCMHLIDWDDTRLGPAERDLAYVARTDSARFLRKYLQARKKPPILRAQAFEFYLYRWCLAEIADYAGRILAANASEAALLHAWKELREYLPVPHAQLRAGTAEMEQLLAELGPRVSQSAWDR